ECGVELVADRLLEPTVAEHLVEGPGDQSRCRLVAGGDEADDLIAQLLIAEDAAIRVLGGDEGAQEVALVRSLSAAAGDLFEHDDVGPGPGAHGPPVG